MIEQQELRRRSSLGLHALVILVILVILVTVVTVASGTARADTRGEQRELAALRAEFRSYSGASLFFGRRDLPAGQYYDAMPALAARRRIAAARIALSEIKKYPRGYLGELGLGTIGVFSALVAKKGDGFRPYNKHHRGYLYFGLWNGENALVAAYYNDEQLPLTLHHEIFHHVDASRDGETIYRRHFHADDERFAQAVAGERPYPALALGRADRAALAAVRRGVLLEDAVSAYAGKSAGEDQAETARYIMNNLADALLQAAERPELPGSQRILHVLAQYERAGRGSPSRPRVSTAWLVGVALGRAGKATGPRPPERKNPYLEKVDSAIAHPALRAAIRRVQPATVRPGGGSDVNLDRGGLVLTAAHLVDRKQSPVLSPRRNRRVTQQLGLPHCHAPRAYLGSHCSLPECPPALTRAASRRPIAHRMSHCGAFSSSLRYAWSSIVMGRLFDTTVHHHAATATERAVDALLANRAGFADSRAFADAILAALAADPASHEPARAAMAAGDIPAASGAGPAAAARAASPPVSDDLLGRIGAAMSEEDSEVRIAFFQQAAACFPGCAVLRALCGDALLTADHVADAVDQLLAAFELDHTLFDEFDEVAELARSLGGRPWLRYQLAELRAIMATAEARAGNHDSSPDSDDDDDDDSDDRAAEVRERYSELLEEHSADPDAMAAIRAVGVRITALEAAGVLPQVLIRRGTWRPR